tara:strand:+ start:1071 stop:1238 length:168 start_codon:yes stop_codon:yes gene_type:complete
MGLYFSSQPSRIIDTRKYCCNQTTTFLVDNKCVGSMKTGDGPTYFISDQKEHDEA